MRNAVPSLPAVMLTVMALFQGLAAFATFIPSFVHDRVPEQFIPVWTFLTTPICRDAPNEAVILTLAVASQWIIGISEAIISIALGLAVLWPRRRRGLANFGLGYSTELFGAFLFTMFAMHDKKLPAWNQYPAILAWIAATWLVVALTDRSNNETSSRSAN